MSDKVYIVETGEIKTLPFKFKGRCVTIPKKNKYVSIPEITTKLYYDYNYVDGELVYKEAPLDWKELELISNRKTRGIRLKIRKKDTRTARSDGTGGALKALSDDLMMEFASQQLGNFPIYEIPEGSLYATEEYIYLLYVTTDTGFVYNIENNTIEFQMGTGSEVMRSDVDPTVLPEEDAPLIQVELLDSFRIEGNLIIAA